MDINKSLEIGLFTVRTKFRNNEVCRPFTCSLAQRMHSFSRIFFFLISFYEKVSFKELVARMRRSTKEKPFRLDIGYIKMCVDSIVSTEFRMRIYATTVCTVHTSRRERMKRKRTANISLENSKFRRE